MAEVPRVTLLGVSVQDRAVDGVMEVLRLTVPVNPLIEAIVTIEVTREVALVVRLAGLVAMEKSWTFML